MNCKLSLFSFMLMLMLTCNLNAQEASSETPDDPKASIADMLDDDEGEELADFSDSDDAASEDESDEELNNILDSGDAPSEEALDEELGKVLDADGETSEDETGDEDEKEEDEDEQYENAPISIRVDENGQLVGHARASVSGDWQPVEAKIALVSNGVLLNKVLASEDGSFAFQDIAPGSYNVYGTASSFCGQRTVTVLSEPGCCDNVGLGLTQDSKGACYSELSSAPAATFAEAPSFGGEVISGGGFSSGGGGIAAGGGGGGGVARGVSGLRLLGAAGIVTAIAVSDSDDEVASPSN